MTNFKSCTTFIRIFGFVHMIKEMKLYKQFSVIRNDIKFYLSVETQVEYKLN